MAQNWEFPQPTSPASSSGVGHVRRCNDVDRVDPVVYCRPGYFADQRRGVDRFEKNGMKIYRAPATIYFGEEPPALPAPARRRFHAGHVWLLLALLGFVGGAALLYARHGLAWAVVGVSIWVALVALCLMVAWLRDVV